MNARKSVAALICLVLVSCVVGEGVAQQELSGRLSVGKSWETPFFVNDSGVEGPVVLLTSGIHGNEPAGAQAAQQIRHWPLVRGKIVVIPRVNTLGLDKNTRYIPNSKVKLRDLNRNFPSPGILDEPQGAIARELWQFVIEQNPDWLFDLHEGFEFHVSHKPKPGKEKSVGSSVIFPKALGLGIANPMLAAVNQSVTNPNRKFVLLGRGPVKTSLARAVIDVLDKNAMILETTFKSQRLPLRARQHRIMMNAALKNLGMIDRDCVDILVPPKTERRQTSFVALYDDEGGTSTGVNNLERAMKTAPDVSVVRVDRHDLQPHILDQFDVVMFGGGSGSKEASTIGKRGAETVQSFVRQGGGYVGVCAGAYLCSSHYSWSLDLIDTKVFTGSREIEGVGRKQMWYRGKPSSQKMELTEAGQKLFSAVPTNVEVRYQNGPIVSPKNSPELTEYEVLAWFRSEQVRYPPQKGTMINTPAVVRGSFGAGQVISISPHPEATPGIESMIVAAVKAVASDSSSTQLQQGND